MVHVLVCASRKRTVCRPTVYGTTCSKLKKSAIAHDRRVFVLLGRRDCAEKKLRGHRHGRPEWEAAGIMPLAGFRIALIRLV